MVAAFPDCWRDHVITLLGTGLRFGELAGLRRRRVNLEARRLQVVEVRYQAGKFGSGFKPRPKSDAGIREVPLAGQVVEAISHQLPPGDDPEDLVFTGPGGGPGRRGGPGVKRGTRTVLHRENFRRVYQRAAQRAGLDQLDLRGPHDLRHAFSTWLEDAGIPARVIDEVMGHRDARQRSAETSGSAIGAVYRHTSSEMWIRVIAAIEDQLVVVLKVASDLLAGGSEVPRPDEPVRLPGDGEGVRGRPSPPRSEIADDHRPRAGG
jgi:integrase